MANLNIFKSMVEKHNIEFIDLRFTDTKGKEQHVTLPITAANESFFNQGKMFDGSSIEGWKSINESDMLLMPHPETVLIDPFFEAPTLMVRCDILEPETMQAYNRDPRSIAKRGEKYLQLTGIADKVFIGPEPEFFVFENINYKTDMEGAEYKIFSNEAPWSSNYMVRGQNKGHRPTVKGGYFPVPPVDSLQDVRSKICTILSSMGQEVEVHHHEVATAGQCEVGTKFATLTEKADQLQSFKYVVHNVAHSYNKTATFMPKPILGDNGSGMHIHQSLFKDDVNIFAGNGYAGLSDQALYYIGGIIKHAKSLNAFCNPSTNSYKRLIPGFEAPVLLAYSSRNRSASIRIPFITNEKDSRIELRFGDPMANPYLAFTAILMAGIDGIKNKIHPGLAMDKNLYNLPLEELVGLPRVASSLKEALKALDCDHDFLTVGGVFSEDMIRAYIALKQLEVEKLNMAPHPVEFEMYYSL